MALQKKTQIWTTPTPPTLTKNPKIFPKKPDSCRIPPPPQNLPKNLVFFFLQHLVRIGFSLVQKHFDFRVRTTGLLYTYTQTVVSACMCGHNKSCTRALHL